MEEIIEPIFNPVYVWSSEDISPDLLQLCNAAIFALREEDASLSKAFAKIPQNFKDFYSDSNQGLAYEVFETALVYIIFKSWIPLAPTAWEDNYEDDSHKKADLVVYDKETQKAKYIFEAKWWMKNTKIVHETLKK